ncbi:hypothetical protein K438DRAFT_1784420 [Mycena galopus ATCC 62051]|nr:hypothetical protein K438DRAFT_1784420 [Mycena galopus ATCC 62051]
MSRAESDFEVLTQRDSSDSCPWTISEIERSLAAGAHIEQDGVEFDGLAEASVPIEATGKTPKHRKGNHQATNQQRRKNTTEGKRKEKRAGEQGIRSPKEREWKLES